MKALYIASTGMAAQERNVEVISNNIANMRTSGFKRSASSSRTCSISPTAAPARRPPNRARRRLSASKSARASHRRHTRIMSQGSVTQTEKELDLAVRGEGFFMIQLPDGRTGYTRDGSFERDGTGLLVNVDGYQVQPGITIPENANSLSISADGIVQAYIGTDTAPTQLGQIQMARFVNKAGLESNGDNTFVETAASGAPSSASPTPTAWAMSCRAISKAPTSTRSPRSPI
jgi:flagellar basal-body rod protein FlgG